jgi:hypothetical protein
MTITLFSGLACRCCHFFERIRDPDIAIYLGIILRIISGYNSSSLCWQSEIHLDLRIVELLFSPVVDGFCQQLKLLLSTLLLPDDLTSGLMFVEPAFITVGLAIWTIAVCSALFDILDTLSRHSKRPLLVSHVMQILSKPFLPSSVCISKGEPSSAAIRLHFEGKERSPPFLHWCFRGDPSSTFVHPLFERQGPLPLTSFLCVSRIPLCCCPWTIHVSKEKILLPSGIICILKGLPVFLPSSVCISRFHFLCCRTFVMNE